MVSPDYSSLLTAAAPDTFDEAEPERDLQRIGDQLLTQTTRIRRAGRRQSGQPVELTLLTGAQLELVRLVRRRPGISIADAAQELALAPNTVSTLVRQLTEGELLVRRVNPGDRRMAQLDLSHSIRHKVDAWRDRRLVALCDAIGRLPDGEQRQLASAVSILARVAEQLETPREERWPEWTRT